MKKIPFNVPPFADDEEKYVNEAILSHHICGDNAFTMKCEKLMEEKFKSPCVLLTTSGTTALEMACMLADIGPGDEVILPSYTFSSTANAIVIFGGVPVFVDIREDSKNINEELIEAAITEKTKAIMVVHYAGVGCDMDKILEIAKRHNLVTIEDSAQGVNALYKGTYLGTIADLGCYSFHETKNYSMGEGGAILINNPAFLDRAAIVREKGTNRTQFKNGQVDKYTWVDKGSSYLPSDILAAYLYPQLLDMDKINDDRLASFNTYMELLRPLKEKGLVDLPVIPEGCEHNGHMFYVMCKDLEEREALQRYLREFGIGTAFHYVPLHSAPEGIRAGRMASEDRFTTSTFERLLRMPMYYRLTKEDIEYVCEKIADFYAQKTC
ncbi:MAG: dTDP-4-amino-4,6-dideoxygalactose transaminase [Erysipelotrichaceae bacterium]|nr:dTDP-4-amino-4,6-dideoxygalactose transaminase [Erysipelotrichaceae bacterium]